MLEEDWKEHLHLTLVPHIRITVMVLKNQTSTMKDPKSLRTSLSAQTSCWLMALEGGGRGGEGRGGGESKLLALKPLPFRSVTISPGKGLAP